MKKKVRRLASFGAVILLFLMILSYLTHRSRFDVVTYATDRVWIEPSGALSSFCESTYQLFYEPIRGKKGVVNLHANFEHQPLIVFCPTNNGRIFCFFASVQHVSHPLVRRVAPSQQLTGQQQHLARLP